MPCLGPLTAYRPRLASGDTRLVFDKRKSETGIPISVPCGKCIGCKLEHSRRWAVRCMHEKRMHTDSCFITLTYDNDHLPPGGTLVKRDLQLFMKRLRKQFGNGVRFFACGEYGEQSLRPHYHVLLLNKDFADKRPFKTGSEYTLFTSPLLSKLWTHGNNALGSVTFDSAAYVARYCTKKITGPKAAAHYGNRIPEFLVMSRRPGIGTAYLEKYKSEMYTHDNIIVNGVPTSIPRFYDEKYASLNDTCEARLAVLKIARRRKIDRSDNSSRRRYAKEMVILAKLKNKAQTI